MKADIALFSGRLKINKIFIIAAAVMCFFVGTQTVAVFATAIILHEAAHCIFASALGLKVYELKVMPYGCEAIMDEFMLSGTKGIIVAAAGPAANIICAAMAYMAVHEGYLGAIAFDVIRTNTLLAAVNMLPVMPLDGGRIVKELLSLAMGDKRAENTMYTLGIAAGVAMLAVGVCLAVTGRFTPAFFVMGGFLAYSSFMHKRMPKSDAVTAVGKKRSVKNMEVKQFAVRQDVRAGSVLKMLHAAKYNVIYVLDEDMNEVYKMGENEFLRTVVTHGTKCSMGELVNARKNI